MEIHADLLSRRNQQIPHWPARPKGIGRNLNWQRTVMLSQEVLIQVDAVNLLHSGGGTGIGADVVADAQRLDRKVTKYGTDPCLTPKTRKVPVDRLRRGRLSGSLGFQSRKGIAKAVKAVELNYG